MITSDKFSGAAQQPFVGTMEHNGETFVDVARPDLETGAGRRLTTTTNLSAEELAELERLCFEALPAWARTELVTLRGEVARFQSERSYIIGHNEGWRDALRQEVFAGTVETDSPLEAAAREAGWAIMELVDEIDFRKREEVSDIASRLAKALLATATEASASAPTTCATDINAAVFDAIRVPLTVSGRVSAVYLVPAREAVAFLIAFPGARVEATSIRHSPDAFALARRDIEGHRSRSSNTSSAGDQP
ncbi:hypothetical protein [Shinella kummerowiae]|uniref:hypothetical protein n=1 Tax=Shinella kummerowiae TaxID=417745 RepID=UPI0021B580EF|nr:hypothetical protein [Shinella kummerowiae]MCT7667641.1 hypothetical protein [Shinella kummerowiae]